MTPPRENTTPAIIYRRVSSDDQKETGNGIEAQLYRCEQYCEDHGLTPVAVFTDDGVSGKHPLRDRPAGAQAADLARSIGGVLVAKEPSRLTRNLEDGLHLPEIATLEGWEIHLADRGRVTTLTSSDFLRNGMEALIAEHTRRVISENTSAALRAKLRRGERVGCKPEVTPEAVARAQELRALGLTYQDIATCLDDEGFTPPRTRCWNRKTVSHMVTGEPWGKVSRQMMKEQAS